MSGNFWNLPGIPHKGWRISVVIDLGRDHTSCAMCGNFPVRYLHVMVHDDCPVEMHVGGTCAEKMSESYIGGA